jgi:hypothetical protein
MRMLRVALVLFVLVSFVAATAAVSMAATVTPTARPTVKPTITMMPIKKPSKMIDLTQMKANIEGIYKKLKTGTKMPGANNTTMPAKGMASPVASPTAMPKPAKKLSTPGMRAMPPVVISNIGLLPQLSGSKAKIGSAPGKNLVISVG